MLRLVSSVPMSRARSGEAELGQRCVHARGFFVAEHSQVQLLIGQVGQQGLVARHVSRVDACLVPADPTEEGAIAVPRHHDGPRVGVGGGERELMRPQLGGGLGGEELSGAQGLAEADEVAGCGPQVPGAEDGGEVRMQRPGATLVVADGDVRAVGVGPELVAAIAAGVKTRPSAMVG